MRVTRAVFYTLASGALAEPIHQIGAPPNLSIPTPADLKLLI